jgi:hypothetical protein
MEIMDLRIAHPVAPPAAAREVRRSVQVLHVAGNGCMGEVKPYLSRCGSDRLSSRATNTIECHSWRADEDAAVDSRLPGWNHSVASLHNVPQHDGIDLCRLELGAAERLANVCRTGFGRRRRLQ